VATAEVYCSTASGPCALPDVGSFKLLAAGMGTARAAHTATLLADGTVLVAGGFDATGTPAATAELYCAVTAGPPCTAPNVGTFQPVAVNMGSARMAHTATLLPDNTVLVAGGNDASTPTFPPTATAELYCTGLSAICGAGDIGKFKATTGTMGTARGSHTATLLTDGTVLIAGGEVDDLGNNTNTADIYCAAAGPCGVAGTFTASTNNMGSNRSAHTASLLQDGRVVVAGGYDAVATATVNVDLYCASAAGSCAGNLGKFVSAGPLAAGRANQTSTLLTDGWVVAAGGVDASSAVLASSELFDPAIAAFAAGGTMSSPRSGHAATRLGDGRVLVTGGRNGLPGTVLNTAEYYNGP
jgi:hypothetical protein